MAGLVEDGDVELAFADYSPVAERRFVCVAAMSLIPRHHVK